MANMSGMGSWLGMGQTDPTLSPSGDTYASPIVTTAVDWSNPSATIVAGDIMPSGDTYAGAPITVAQAQATPGLLTAGTPGVASATTISPTTLALIVGGGVLLLMSGKK